ncbi:MAG: hypothetical protein KC619_15710 [Myxococcales bacterium]|nr:hypothetical protein [Myxococcales bacterium]
MPHPLGPYRDTPASAARLAEPRVATWIALGGAALALLGLGAWLAPGVTAAVVGAVLFYVVAPWFVTRAPGP